MHKILFHFENLTNFMAENRDFWTVNLGFAVCGRGALLSQIAIPLVCVGVTQCAATSSCRYSKGKSMRNADAPVASPTPLCAQPLRSMQVPSLSA
jgi:hypothetical protein